MIISILVVYNIKGGEVILDMSKQRDKFPILKNKIYFLTPSTGLIPNYVYKAVKHYQDERFFEGGDSNWDGMNTLEMIEFSKKQLGMMLGCDRRNITFRDNSSRMLNLFINGIDFKKGDNVIITEDALLWKGVCVYK